jgi:hypothetical protein
MKNLSLLFIAFLLLQLDTLAQYPDWINYTNGQWVYALSDNGNELWIGAG